MESLLKHIREEFVAKGYTGPNGVEAFITGTLPANFKIALESAINSTSADKYPQYYLTSNKYKDTMVIVRCGTNLQEDMDIALGFAGCINAIGMNTAVITAEKNGNKVDVSTFIIRKDKTAVTAAPEGHPNYAFGFTGKQVLSFDDYMYFINREYEKKAQTKKMEVPKVTVANTTVSAKTKAELEMIAHVEELSENINWILYENGDIPSDLRMMAVIACILALRDESFRDNYKTLQANQILDAVINAVEKSLVDYMSDEDGNLSQDEREKIDTMVDSFKRLKSQHSFAYGKATTTGVVVNPMTAILDKMDHSVLSTALETNGTSYDILGTFYNEFITHGKGAEDASSGFVLTPRHICELFADLACVNKDSKIVDVCFGSGGFLVAALDKALEECSNEAERKNVKHNNMYGIEYDANKFTYGCANMIMRGDGHSHMKLGDCFSTDSKEYIKAGKCSVGLMNPPYALARKGGNSELEFIDNMLDCLAEGGIGIAIVPMSCATDKKSTSITTKERILSKHTLEAVLSMPDQLFYPVGTVTCIMIFTAHKPHDSKKESWFASCKEDGFVIDRTSGGRADINNKWEDIKKQWVNAFIDRDVINGFSVKQAVTANDEWSYEAYAKTDFTGITEDSFKKVVKEYALFQLSQLEV